MYNPDNHCVRSGNQFTLTLTTPIVHDGKEPGDYNKLSNKPRINNVELEGNLSFSDLGLPDLSSVPTQPLSQDELDEITPI